MSPRDDEIQQLQSEPFDTRLSPDILDLASDGHAIQINPIKPTDLKSYSNLMCSKSTKTAKIELFTDSKQEIKEIKEIQ